MFAMEVKSAVLDRLATPPPVVEQSIVMSMSACLFVSVFLCFCLQAYLLGGQL